MNKYQKLTINETTLKLFKNSDAELENYQQFSVLKQKTILKDEKDFDSTSNYFSVISNTPEKYNFTTKEKLLDLNTSPTAIDEYTFSDEDIHEIEEDEINETANSKMNKLNRSINNKGLTSMNTMTHIARRSTINEEEFIKINESEVENLPIKFNEKDIFGYYKGVVRAGFTNLNYIMNDKGLLKIFGVRPLKLTQNESKVHLLNGKTFGPGEMFKFMIEFK